MMVLGSAVMKEEDLWGAIISIMWSERTIYIYIPRTCYIDCIYHLQYSSLCKINGVLTLLRAPGVGILTCRCQIPCVSPYGHGVVGMSWIGTLLISSCITIIYYCILNWIIAMCISGLYLITMTYKTSASCIAREQCQLYYNPCLGLGTLVHFFCACKDDWASFLKALRSLMTSSHIVNLFLHFKCTCMEKSCYI